MLLSIITPTYNRGYCLGGIYQSLKEFEFADFEWIIVDDGSSDDTASIVQVWLEEMKINLRYITQENSGKTNAVIRAFAEKPIGKYSLILDSDDVLVPGAFDLFKEHVSILDEGEIGLAFLKSTRSGALIGSTFKRSTSDYIDMYFGRYRCFGDKLFVVKTDIYNRSLVVSYPDEKLIPEGVIYMNMQKFGKFRCINKIIYSGDYLNDGLSVDTIRLAAKNINGFILEKQMLQRQPLDLVSKVKNEIKYIVYSVAGRRKLSCLLHNSHHKLLTTILFFPSLIIGLKYIYKIRRFSRSDKMK
ncbi:glycosyltransferase family A protein [uncultured Sphingobacterium sp.]|uniref:glycosyltransferase family 2 protein n=1 Tax=uncultured Sphingobacterium sp. TaxID=182688 RepID=UPI0025D8D539|nr:glycosyltransferase family A protein [uncultured Sphingobacterium sp.]